MCRLFIQSTQSLLFVQFRLNTTCPRLLRDTVSTTNNRTSSGMDRTQTAWRVNARGSLILNRSICSNDKTFQTQTDFSSFDSILFCCVRLSTESQLLFFLSLSFRHHRPRPSRGGHSAPLSSPLIVMTTEGICLSAGRHSEQCYSTTVGALRLIYTERSCRWWFLVWSGPVWPLKNTSWSTARSSSWCRFFQLYF